MKILITSPAFLPAIGGLELVTAQLAEGLVQRGHEVAVVTLTPARDAPEPGPYRVLRSPTRVELLRLTRWCDVYFQANLSLRMLWPLAVTRRPWVVSHHSWYRRPDGRRGLRDRLKICLTRFAAASIAVSRAVAEDLGGGALVIENAYRDQVFRGIPGVAKDRQLVFVGRLVSDKGCDLLLDALSRLDSSVCLSVVGDGPERARLERQAVALGIVDRLSFLGTRGDEELARILNSHEVLVVPSRYREPFGIVALEGIACGCVVVASEGGGLKDAVGPCGRTFPNGDVAALAQGLAEVLADGELRARCRAAAPAHLEGHRQAAVLERYAQVLDRVTRP